MAFCTSCGAQIVEGTAFCVQCGAQLIQAQAPAPAPMPMAPMGTPVAPAAPVAPMGVDVSKFSKITVRHCCQQGHVFDGTEDQVTCPKCNSPLNKGGYIQLYRMGNFMGMAVGMGVYVDEIPYGHIGNKQSIRISVPYGTHKLHVTHTTTRSCNDPLITITPEMPYAWCKCHFSAAGFAITVEPADPVSMPTR